MPISSTLQQQINTWARNFLLLFGNYPLLQWYRYKKVPNNTALIKNANAEGMLFYNFLIKPYVNFSKGSNTTVKFNVDDYPNQIAELRAQAINLAQLAGARPVIILLATKIWDSWYAKYITRYNK